MMITEYLKDNNLIICPNTLKRKIVNEINSNNKIVSFRIMDLIEFKKNYFFDYDKKTIYYLMKKLNLKYEIVLEYIEACYYIENKKYNSTKLNQLLDIKNDLINNNLLIFDDNFKYYLSNTNIIILGYGELDDFYLNIFENYNYSSINILNDKRKHTVFEFDDIDEELIYVAFDIKSKLDTGININDIKLINPSSEYIEPLKRIFKLAKLPINIENRVSIYNLPVGNKILELISNNISFLEIIEQLRDKVDTTIFNQIISIFNEYIELSVNTNELYNLIEYDLKHTFISNEAITNSINTISIEEINDTDYVYLLGFNKENYPIIHKDEELLTDNMKQELNLFTSNDLNINSINKLKNNLNQQCNMFISYKLKTAFESYNPSLIIQEEGYEVIKNPKTIYNFSNDLNKIILAKNYDNYYKYGIHNGEMDILRFNYPDIEYRKYNNQFTGIDQRELLDHLNQPFTVSYSTIDEYYRCSFRYYISNILKIKQENIDDFYQNIGNIFHYVLSKCFSDDFDFDQTWNEEASKYEFTLAKLILLDKLKTELKYDIQIIKKHLSYTTFDSYLYEKRFSLPIINNYNIPVNFVGVVDKICYLKNDNHTLVSIVDYKTGHLPSNLNNIIYGIGMQLPIYLYFVKRSAMFPNLEIVGFYLQKIINKEMKVVKDKTLDELKENALKLVGYSTDKEDLLEKYDMTYQDSAMISGLKKKKEGFYAYSKVLNDKQINKIDEIVDKNINKAVNSILNGEFLINPKKIDKDNIGCEFCSYRDICYKKEEDTVELEKHQNLDFLSD